MFANTNKIAHCTFSYLYVPIRISKWGSVVNQLQPGGILLDFLPKEVQQSASTMQTYLTESCNPRETAQFNEPVICSPGPYGAGENWGF